MGNAAAYAHHGIQVTKAEVGEPLSSNASMVDNQSGPSIVLVGACLFMVVFMITGMGGLRRTPIVAGQLATRGHSHAASRTSRTEA